MNNEPIQTAEATASPTFVPTALPEADGASNSMSQAIPSPAGTMPISKQAQRYQLSSKFDPSRCEIESQVSKAVNAECGPRYKGAFEIRFDNPNEVTTKTLSAFCGNGAVFFTPNDLDQHPALKRVRKTEGGINLSALMTQAKRPKHIDDAAWQGMTEMWTNVSKALYTQGLAPMHVLIMGVLAANGLGGPKINKKLCGSINEDIGDKHELMCKVLDELNELLAPPKTN